MRLAMPIWRDRLSPVMDVATRLLIIDLDDQKEIARREESIARQMAPQLARRLAELGVSVLICGGISQPLFALITAQGISVIPWMTGQSDEILSAYMDNRLHGHRFLMPGCGRGGRGRGRGYGRGKGQGRGRGFGRGQGQQRRRGRGAEPSGLDANWEGIS